MTDEQRRALAAGYGLDPDTASEADIMSAAAESARARSETPQPSPDPTPAPAPEPDPDGDPEPAPEPQPDPNGQPAEPVTARAVPAGAVLIDAEELAALRAGAQTANDLAAERAREARDLVMASAIREGRFAPSRRQHYERAWQADPEGTRMLLTAPESEGGLAPNTIPVQARAAQPSETADAVAAASGTGWFPNLTQQGV